MTDSLIYENKQSKLLRAGVPVHTRGLVAGTSCSDQSPVMFTMGLNARENVIYIQVLVSMQL